MSINLIVPLEMVDYPVASRNTGINELHRSYMALNDADYDGATYYLQIVATNANASNNYSVTLRNITDSTDAVSISVPLSTTTRTRYLSASFSPASGNKTYAIHLPQTAASSDVKVYSARIIVVQSSATKTRIQFPLIAALWSVSPASAEDYIDHRNNTAYGQGVAGNYSRFLKESGVWADKVAGTPWTFEAVLSASNASATGYAELRNITDSTDVTASEISSTGTTHTLVSVDFADNATNWDDNDDYEVYIKVSNATYYCQLDAARVYLRLTNLSSVQVYYRIGDYIAATTSAASVDSQRHKIDINSFTSPSTYFEATGNCVDNGTAISLSHDSTNDSGVAGWTGVANINFNSGTKARQRVSASITDGYRYVMSKPSTTNSGTIAAGYVVVKAVAAGSTNYNISITANATVTASLLKDIGITIIANATTTASLSKNIGKTLVAYSTISVKILKDGVDIAGNLLRSMMRRR